jgi:hypothetical protein
MKLIWQSFDNYSSDFFFYLFLFIRQERKRQRDIHPAIVIPAADKVRVNSNFKKITKYLSIRQSGNLDNNNQVD